MEAYTCNIQSGFNQNDQNQYNSLAGKKRKKTWHKNDFKGSYLKRDLQIMMYGFGDSVNTNPETLDLMENLVVHALNR